MSRLHAPSEARDLPRDPGPDGSEGSSQDTARRIRVLLWLCVLIAGLRLVSLLLFPLLDRTESRYGEIARQMVLTGDWVTPQVNGEPFWGKPPLSTWCQAASVRVFGANEFGVRFPAWIVTVLSGFVIWHLARLWLTDRHAWVAASVFAGAPLSIGMAGATMTDPFLVFGLTVALYGLARWCLRTETTTKVAWSVAVLYGSGLAIGALAKGPIAVVFGGAPLLAWFCTASGRADLRRWPWLRSLFVFFALSVPWFVAAEIRTPGFLDYFFVGEHWHRYVNPDWTGDRYGGTHPTTKGAVWVYFAVGFLTWIAAVIHAWWTRRTRPGADALTVVLWVSVLTPLVLFSFAGSVLMPYAFPAIPAACLLLSRALGPRATIHALGSAAVVCLGAVVWLSFQPAESWARRSHRPILAGLDYDRIVYCRPLATIYSAQFYSGGRAVSVQDLTEVDWTSVRANLERVRFATKRGDLVGVPTDIRDRLVVERDFEGYYQVWRAR